jgi:hypothetical protein
VEWEKENFKLSKFLKGIFLTPFPKRKVKLKTPSF